VPSPRKKPASCIHRQRFGRSVARLRTALALTQQNLAEEIGVSVRYLQSIESGTYWPSLPTLIRLRAKLKAKSWDELIPK